MAEPNDWTPRKVVLFSGHMIDAPGREKPRFPPDKEPIAANAIGAALAGLDVGARDLCICGGACGGDLLFAEAALARWRGSNSISVRRGDVSHEIGRFCRRRLARPVLCGEGASDAARAAARDGEDAEGEDPYERNNLWMLDAASRFGPDKVDLCLPLERRGRRRAGRRAAHDGRGPKSGAGGRCGSTRRSSGGDGEASGPFSAWRGREQCRSQFVS